MIRIRAFKATSNLESCKLFADGHEQVLRDFGVLKVTSANTDWFYNDHVYVILVEDSESGKVYGGARIHLADGINPLPVEEAIGEMDPNIKGRIQADLKDGVGEMCGLWNAKEIRGSGVSILLTKASVAKAGAAIANLLKIKTLWVLCAPYTVEMVRRAGFEIESDLGDQGTFPYPKPDWLATVLACRDTDALEKAEPTQREDIFDLRTTPTQNKVEEGPKGELIIEYDLFIKDLTL